jgi:hypothetical protein
MLTTLFVYPRRLESPMPNIDNSKKQNATKLKLRFQYLYHFSCIPTIGNKKNTQNDK